MRRTLAALTATAVLVPLAVTAAPGAASAATNTLTVTTYNRQGKAVTSQVYAANLSTGDTHLIDSGRTAKLPKGSYALITTIQTRNEWSWTLGGRVLKVNGATKAKFDARAAQQVRVGLSPAAQPNTQNYDARICAGRASLAATGLEGGLYLLPNSSPHLGFAYVMAWEEEHRSASEQDVRTTSIVWQRMQGLPQNHSKTFNRAGLSPVDLQVRSRSAADYSASVSASTTAKGCGGGLQASIWFDTWKPPLRTTAYLQPGTWEFNAESELYDWQRQTRTIERGKSYTEMFFRAGTGPTGDLPYVSNGRLHLSTDSLFIAPDFRGNATYAGNAPYQTGVTTRVTLTRGGKTLKTQDRRSWPYTFSHRLPSAGWYGLTLDARPQPSGSTLPSDMLSSRAVLKFRFHADPKKSQVASVYLPRLTAKGLSMRNSAKPGSTTTVGIRLERQGQDVTTKLTKPNKVKEVRAQASYDGGKTWKNITVKKSGSQWVTTVKNPNSGFVTLRVKVTDVKGNASQLALYRVYRIG